MNEKMSLLVADDETIIRRKVRMMLGATFRLHEVATADEVRRAAVEQYDAILLDIVFPDGNGIDLCREIKQRHPYTTVVISSSQESVDAWDQAFQAGADGYLEKRELMGLAPRKIVLTISNLVERNRLKRQTDETNRRRSELLAVLSHDVRAPFQALLGTITLLRKNSIPPDASQNVDILYRCATDQLAFINSLLELLRLESGVTELRLHPMDINLPVNQCLQGLAVLATAKEISLRAELQPDLPRIDGDIGKLAQLVSNLITNAIKFTPKGGKICVRTGAVALKDRPGIEFVVEDTGVGIRPEDREKMFQRFGRGRDRGTDGETGTGLGLSICQQIAQLHGGTLTAGPAKQQGTVFTAWFPALSPLPEKKRVAGAA